MILMVLLSAAAASAQESAGMIVGRVTDKANGKPLSFANVLVVGTHIGAMTRDDGSYEIHFVPPGTYSVKTSYLGYEAVTKDNIVITAGATVTADFSLKETVATQTDEVLVTAERPLVDVQLASTTRSLTSEDISRLTAEPALASVIEQQAGVTKDNDEIHIRGGRSDEVLFVVDGVKMKDVLSGETALQNLSARSVAELNVITGGYDAKYGQALSGVIEAKLKEGTPDFHGYLSYTTDRTPFSDNYNTDIMNFQVQGPNLLFTKVLPALGIRRPGNATFFLDLSTDLSDGYLPGENGVGDDYWKKLYELDEVKRPREYGYRPDAQSLAEEYLKPLLQDTNQGRLHPFYHDSFMGRDYTYGSFFVPRAENDWRLSFKTAWQPFANHKFNLSVTKAISFDQGFSQSDIGDVTRNTSNYPWAWARRLNHYTTSARDWNTMALSWTQSLGKNAFHTLRFTRSFSGTNSSVNGKLWGDYVPGDDSQLQPFGLDLPFFYDSGDAPDWRDRFVTLWSANWDWAYNRPPRHQYRWGLEAQYEDVQYLSIKYPWDEDPDGLGSEHDLFHVYPNTGALYAQDRLEYEGFIANLGLRYDYWFPGALVERYFEDTNRVTVTPELRKDWYADTSELFGHRMKGRISPRLSISHPITENSNLFFNYGHFTQRPTYFYVYAKTSAISSESFPRIGNPNLNPEVAVQYEVGARHQFRKDAAVNVTLFYKDIYDYPTSVTVTIENDTGTARRSNFFLYRNVDYARSRGFEIEVRKRRLRFLSGSVSYSYSLATGKSSDPNLLKVVQAAGGDARETDLEEVFMWWNRPHKLTVSADYRVDRRSGRPKLLGVRMPDNWGLNFYYLIRTGKAYTPVNPVGLPTGKSYSKNGPFDSSLNFTLTKSLKLGGRELELTLQGWNMLNHKTVTVSGLDTQTGRPRQLGYGGMSGPWSSDRGYLYDVFSAHDPSNFERMRTMRLGIGYEF